MKNLTIGLLLAITLLAGVGWTQCLEPADVPTDAETFNQLAARYFSPEYAQIAEKTDNVVLVNILKGTPPRGQVLMAVFVISLDKVPIQVLERLDDEWCVVVWENPAWQEMEIARDGLQRTEGGCDAFKK